MGRIRRSLLAVLVLVGLLVGLDRGTAYVASQAVANRIRAAEGLSSQPGVDISGFPFLSQVIGGRYDHVRVTITGLDRGGLRVTRIVVDLRGARVPLRAVVGGRLQRIPVDDGSAQVFVGYAELDASLEPLTVSYGGAPGEVVLSAGGIAVHASLTVSGDTISVSTPSGPLSFSRTLARLPFGISLTGATAGPAGITIAATARSFTIPA